MSTWILRDEIEYKDHSKTTKMRREEKMKVLVKLFSVLVIISVLTFLSCGKKSEKSENGEISAAKGNPSGTEVKIPWDDYGYMKLTQFHIRYYYIFSDAVDKVLRGEMSWEEAIKDNTGIAEVWFKSDGGLFRFDRYIEKLDAKCQSYEGKSPDTLSYNDKTYYLYERIIQKGQQLTSFTFRSGTQIDYDHETKQAIAESCRYEKSASEKKEMVDQGSAISWMMMGHVSGTGFGFYLTQKMGDEELDKDLEELGESTLELTKLMNPEEYKKIVESWKTKKEIAGRKAVKDISSPPSFKGHITMKGYQFIDTELGIGLEGYLEGCSKSWVYQETIFEEPELVYKALLVETTVSAEVFENF